MDGHPASGTSTDFRALFNGAPDCYLVVDPQFVVVGMSDACARCGAAIAGGHTISDTEPKAGLAVVGSVDPARVWSQRFAREGQALVLTKALGTGVIGQAIRAGTASEASIAAAVEQMVALNDRACAVGLDVGATSCTVPSKA